MKMVRCKVCGFLMPEGSHHDKCPACGVSSKMFEPYTDPVGEARRRWLKLDLHPMAVHLPTSFCVAVLVFAFAGLFFTADAHSLLWSTTKIIATVFPLVMAIAIVLGLLDGAKRFRRIFNSAILKRKIVYGSSLFVISVALAVIVWMDSTPFQIAAVVLAAGGLVFVILLALLGTSINNAAMPGK